MPATKSTTRVRKNLIVQGRRTTVCIETAVWDALLEICRREEVSLDSLCDAVASHKGGISIASALRVTGLRYFRAVCAARQSGKSFESEVTQWVESMPERRTVAVSS